MVFWRNEVNIGSVEFIEFSLVDPHVLKQLFFKFLLIFHWGKLVKLIAERLFLGGNHERIIIFFYDIDAIGNASSGMSL